MASKGRRPARATVKSAFSGRTYHISLQEADRRSGKGGDLEQTENRVFVEAVGHSGIECSPTILTDGDMHGVVQRHPRALRRFRNWHLEHDRRTVTVVAGRIWVPDQQASAIRAKLVLQEHGLRRQQEAVEIRKQMLNAKKYANDHRN